jgi:hypothetical protein
MRTRATDSRCRARRRVRRIAGAQRRMPQEPRMLQVEAWDCPREGPSASPQRAWSASIGAASRPSKGDGHPVVGYLRARRGASRGRPLPFGRMPGVSRAPGLSKCTALAGWAYGDSFPRRRETPNKTIRPPATTPSVCLQPKPGDLPRPKRDPRTVKGQRRVPRRRSRSTRTLDCSWSPLSSLLDHLVRAQQQRLRDGEAERLGGLEVDE